jgi:hypothetical protein
VIASGPGDVRIGPSLVRIAASVASNTTDLIRPHLRALGEEVGETVDLAVLSGGSTVFVDQVPGRHRLVAISAVGERFPLHCTANGKAILACFSPEDAEETFLDNDRDDLNNLDEFTLNTDPHNSDTDSDTMKDGWEVLYGLNPLLNDGQGHSDNDGLTNSREFQLGTDPTKGDTDNDEMPDGWEVLYALDPLNSFDATQDPDADGYPNLMEYANNTSPRVFNAGGNPNSPPSLIRPTKSQVKAIIDEQFTLTPEAACVCILSKTRQSSAVGASYQAKLAGPQSVYYSAFSSSSQTSTYGLHSRAQETIIPNPDESLYTSWHSVKN